MKVCGPSISFLMVSYVDETGHRHERILVDSTECPDGGTSFDGWEEINNCCWIDYGKWHFAASPQWPLITIRGRLADDGGREYFTYDLKQLYSYKRSDYRQAKTRTRG